MKHSAVTIGLMIVLLCGIHDTSAQTVSRDDVMQLIVEANGAYRGGDYDRAADLYEQVLDTGHRNGHLYYNLGNALLKNGELGEAILNYRKALLLLPRDEDLDANMQYARNLVTDTIECREIYSFFRKFCFWYTKLNVYEIAGVFLAFNFLLWATVCLKMFVKREYVTHCLYFFLFMTAVFAATLGVKLYAHHYRHAGVVTAGEIMVRSGNSTGDTVLFKLHEGTEFRWRQENSGWVKIELCDGKKGWVQEQVVGKVILQ